MAIDRITTGAVLDGAIATADIADDAVTGAKIENNPTVAGNLATGGTLAIAGHGSIGNAGTVAGTRALTVVGATDGTSSQILVGYNSSLSSKFSVRDDGYTTIGAGMNVQGNISVPSSSGIDFSSHANAAGMTSELLDDYEEGTFTPVFQQGISSAGYAVQVGTYIKIGRQVTASIYLRANSGTENSSHIYIGGLPYAFTNDIDHTFGAFFTYNGGFWTSSVNTTWLGLRNTAYLAFYKQNDGGSIVGNNSDVANNLNADCRITVVYRTD